MEIIKYWIHQNPYGKYIVVLEATAEKDLKRHYKAGDKGTIKRINQIYEELKVHPTTGIGNPEALKHNLSGLWSRRIINRID